MFTHPIGLISLSGLVIGATAPVALAQQNPFLNAQNPVTALQNGITFNPVPSTSSTLLPPRPENPVSPALPTALLPNTTGTNPLTGLPCTEPGSLSVSGAGTLPGSSPPPVNRKWRRDWNRRRDDFSNTRLLKRLPTREQLGCVLIHLRYRAAWCAKGVRSPDATRHQTGQCPLCARSGHRSELSREPGGDLAQRWSRSILSRAHRRSDVNEPRYALVRRQAKSIEHAAIIGVPTGDPARPISERVRCEDKVHSSGSRG
jgi:hypothetical protein